MEIAFLVKLAVAVAAVVGAVVGKDRVDDWKERKAQQVGRVIRIVVSALDALHVTPENAVKLVDRLILKAADAASLTLTPGMLAKIREEVSMAILRAHLDKLGEQSRQLEMKLASRPPVDPGRLDGIFGMAIEVKKGGGQ